MKSKILEEVRETQKQLREEKPDIIVFKRMGDFYEAFEEDAKRVNEVLKLGMVQRGTSSGEPWLTCGFPYWAADDYIGQMIRGGLKNIHFIEVTV